MRRIKIDPIRLDADKMMKNECYMYLTIYNISRVKRKLWILKWLLRIGTLITGYKLRIEDRWENE